MKALLKVNVNEGLFPNESSVVINSFYSGEIIRTSGFFDNKHIKEGKLEVEVIDEREKSVMVRLPGWTLESPGDKGYLTVRKEDLEYGTCR